MRMPQSQWSMSQISPSDHMTFAHSQLRGQYAVSGNDTIWSGLPSEHHTDESMLSNHDLLYNHDASQNTLDKATDFGSSTFWLPNGMVDTALSPSADILLSPASAYSDMKHSYSPGSDYGPATPGNSRAGYGAKVSSPRFAPPTQQSVILQQPRDAAKQHSLSVPMTSVEGFPMSNILNDATMYGSEDSYGQSQSSSPGITPWFPPGYVDEKAAFAQNPRDHQADTTLFDGRPNSYLAPLDRTSRQRQAQWSNKNAIPSQSHFQTRFMVPPTDSEKEQRSEDDKILLQMKNDGYTYKDIRKRLGRKVAESTLRGRYRSLTKPRNARVRAPKWQEVDVRILDIVIDGLAD